MPQGALPKKRRPNEVRSKGKQYKDHVYHTEYFWMENCLHVWSWVCFLAKMIWNFEYLVMVKNGCAMLIALTRTTASSTAMAVAVTSPLKMIFYGLYFRQVQSAKFTHLTRWLLFFLNKRHFTLSSYKPWQCSVEFRRMGRKLQVNRPWIEAEGKTVDIMKIDHCEGCEWEQFHDWFDDWKEMNLTVRILLLLRCIAKKSPLLQTPDFFAKMCCWGVGLFHFYFKEANTLNTHYL